jgi:hypothetical protein
MQICESFTSRAGSSIRLPPLRRLGPAAGRAGRPGTRGRRLRNLDRRAGDDLVRSGADHAVALGETLAHLHLAAAPLAELDGDALGGAVARDPEHVGARGIGDHRGFGGREHLVPGLGREVQVGEHSGTQAPIGVGDLALQEQLAVPRIERRCHEVHPAEKRLAGIRDDGELERHADPNQIDDRLGHGEREAELGHGVDLHEVRLVVDAIARRDQTLGDDAVERRANRHALELDLREVAARVRGVPVGGRLVELRRGHDALAGELVGATEGALGERDVGLGLVEARALPVVAQAKEDGTLLDVLSLAELDALDHALRLGTEHDRFPRLELTDQAQALVDHRALDRRDLDDRGRRRVLRLLVPGTAAGGQVPGGDDGRAGETKRASPDAGAIALGHAASLTVVS